MSKAATISGYTADKALNPVLVRMVREDVFISPFDHLVTVAVIPKPLNCFGNI